MIKAAIFLYSLIAVPTYANAAQTVVKTDGLGIVEAYFAEDANIYPHRVLGSVFEKQALSARDDMGRFYNVRLYLNGNKRNVFEDIAPRIADVDNDGLNDVIVIETDPELGASIAVYGLQKGKLQKITATDYIGTPFRWLAPVGIADFNGDGAMDIAYVDRPHLVKTLRVVSYRNGKLNEIAKTSNVTNHKIGWNFIASGVRDCGQGPVMVAADGQWRQVISITLQANKLITKNIGTYEGPESISRALTC